MQIIDAVIFEPVGCLAEFGAKEFNEIATTIYGQKKKAAAKSGSDAYWRLQGIMKESDKKLTAEDKKSAEALEIKAVDASDLYEDVVESLTQLKAMGIKMLIASSLSGAATDRFLEKSGVKQFFSGVWHRDNSDGVGAVPVAKAIQGASLDPERVMVLADTEEGLNVTKEVNVNSILMINDYDEGRRLAMHPPTGGIVSLAELPDAIRLVAESAKLTKS